MWSALVSCWVCPLFGLAQDSTESLVCGAGYRAKQACSISVAGRCAPELTPVCCVVLAMGVRLKTSAGSTARGFTWVCPRCARRAADDDLLWRELCLRSFNSPRHELMRVTWRALYKCNAHWHRLFMPCLTLSKDRIARLQDPVWEPGKQTRPSSAAAQPSSETFSGFAVALNLTTVCPGRWHPVSAAMMATGQHSHCSVSF